MDKKIRLVAIDLDGTLLNEQLEVSPRTIRAIREAVKQGVVVTLATGRMFASAQIFARQIGLDVPLITYNGGLIRAALSEETFYHQPIEADAALAILQLFQRHGWYIQSYIDDRLYVETLNELAQTYAKRVRVEPVVVGEQLYSLTEPPTKLLGMAKTQEEVAALIEKLHHSYPGRIYATSSQPGYVEIMHAKVNKGQALASLAERFTVPQKQVMALGDSLNDLDMLEFAGWGVAMGNAADRVKARAQAVTATNQEEGVAQAIETYVLA